MQEAVKAVFLDRDGTIIEDLGYVRSPEQIKFIPGSIEAVKILCDNGYNVVIISNQSGIARDFFSEDVVQTINKIINREILHGGAHITASYYCPHHPEYGAYPYKQTCNCRKPGTGMVDKAIKEHHLNPETSFMVGDKETDIECGKNAGLKTILVLTGKGNEGLMGLTIKPDYIETNLLGAAKRILSLSLGQTNEKLE